MPKQPAPYRSRQPIELVFKVGMKPDSPFHFSRNMPAQAYAVKGIR